MMWILIHRKQEEEIFKLNDSIVFIHSSFTLMKLVVMCHVRFHVITKNFNLMKYPVHGQFLDLKTNYFDKTLSAFSCF